VDRLLGGPGHSVNANRDLSDIEGALLDEALVLILNDWCNQWQKMQELRPVVLGHETAPRFMHTSAHDTVMLVLSMEATLGDCVELMQMAFPYFTIEPLVRQLAAVASPEKETTPRAIPEPRWNAEYDHVSITVTAQWQGLEMTMRGLGTLKPGEILLLDPHCAERVQVNLAEIPKFHGRLGTRAQKWAVELTEIIPR